MLLSVPLMVFFKMSLLSKSVPASYRDPVISFLEGSGEQQQQSKSQHTARGEEDLASV